MAWTSLCEFDDLPDAGGRPFDIDGFRLAAFREGDRVTVTDDACPHAGVSLSAGLVAGGCVTCPRHNWTFNLGDGTVRHTGAPLLRVYPARLLHRHGKPTLVQADLPMF